MPKSVMQTEPLSTDWCPVCLKKVEVVDEFDDVILERGGQRGVRVSALLCGHSTYQHDGTFYPL